MHLETHPFLLGSKFMESCFLNYVFMIYDLINLYCNVCAFISNFINLGFFFLVHLVNLNRGLPILFSFSKNQPSVTLINSYCLFQPLFY